MSRRWQRRRRRAAWLLAAPVAAASTVAGPFRLAAAAGALLVAFVIPMVMRGSLAAVAPALVPRRMRMAQRHGRPRPSTPSWLRKMVYAADRWRCVYCSSREKIQLDHVIPWSFGGLTVLWNLVTLCGRCNRVKSNYWKSDSGKVYYRSFYRAHVLPGAAVSLAELILKRELAARRSPLRWVRAARTWWF